MSSNDQKMEWPPTQEELDALEPYPVREDKWPERPWDITDEDAHGEVYL
tara:strand:+ start:3011 stop:3157 length:147 start_codon:yes stop_codon:yes gene_type:complete